ncbi:MAG: hypothetical protein M3441_07220 [Chloroflexota bacterium]|nr:hypothetical protein [Chloroflexota bacterium]
MDELRGTRLQAAIEGDTGGYACDVIYGGLKEGWRKKLPLPQPTVAYPQ